jgi:poly(3-hydroxybutyrate) depolymerase
MTPARFVHSTVAVLAILGIACSSSTSSSLASGGASGTGGVAGLGGATAKGGAPGSGGASGSGGVSTMGGAPGQGGQGPSGGTTQPGTGGSASGGAGTAGRLGSGGAGIGGASAATGGAAAGSGGSGALGGSSGSASGGSTGSADGGVAQSAGCGKARTLQNGTRNITFGGASRKYILRVPASYDNSHPYRLVFAFAESGSSAQSVADRNYFTMATLDTNSTTIFAAPDAVGSAGSWSKTDVDFTDAILAELEGDLCIDKTRLFATGFSFGGAMSIAIACTRADVFRGVAFFSGADLTGSCPATLTKPIAYYASQASGDSSGTPLPTSGKVKQAEFAAVNGCTPEPNALNFPAAGQPHTCTIYKNCSAGHPTVYCIFNGGHGWEPVDPGQTTSWDAPEAWKFITQF